MAPPEHDPTRPDGDPDPPATERGTIAGDPAGTVADRDDATHLAGDETVGDPGPAWGNDTADSSALLAGRYRLGELLGEGGMGTVYRAEQVRPVRRTVAVKLVKPGMDSSRVIARFEAERQALAVMDHPHIAKVLDAGTTAQGRPFFVMELVEGQPLTAYCDANRLTIRDRLALFVAVCQAVQHAHQKGIIHRDLKPSNILVAEVDGRAMPKVIDFGLAKALQEGSTGELSLDTGFGSILGTPLYMAPEQAELGAKDIDTRADVYALGVVLYELLTGSTPIARESVQGAAFAAVLHLIQSAETPTPTARLRAAGNLPNLAATRGVEPARLAKEVRGDLEWIALKCLEKDRTRRYETVNGLAADVLRHLADEPVAAGPPGRWYRAGKFVRRHRGPVLAASLVFLALVAGVVGTTAGMLRARAAERLAEGRLIQVEQARGEVQKALGQSETARMEAELAEKQAKAVADYLVDAFARPDPSEDGRQIKVVDLLGRASTRLKDDRKMDPLVAARLGASLGRTFVGLGLMDQGVAEYERSRAAYQAARGADHPDTLDLLYKLGYALGEAGRNGEAIQVSERALAGFQAVRGPDHPDIFRMMALLAGRYQAAGRLDEAIRLCERAVGGLRGSPGLEDDSLVDAISTLGHLYHNSGRTVEAIALKQEALRLSQAGRGPGHANTISLANSLAMTYRVAGRTADAVALQVDTLGRIKETYGPTHPRTIDALNDLATTYRFVGRSPEALPLFEEALKIARATSAPDSEKVIDAETELAGTYADLERVSEATPMLQGIVARAKAGLGLGHNSTLLAMQRLAVLLRRSDRVADAIPVFEETLAARKARDGEDAPETSITKTQLASAYIAAGRAAEAVPLLETIQAAQRARLDPDHRDLLVTLNMLSAAFGQLGRTAEAVRLSEQVAAGFRKTFGPDHPDTLASARALAKALRDDRRIDAALLAYRELLPSARQGLPPESPQLASILDGLGETLLASGAYDQAEPVLRECVAIREKAMPENWRTFDARSMLGEALAGLKRDEAARPLLVEGYNGLKARSKSISAEYRPRLVAALDRLIAFLESRQDTAEAARLRAERPR